MARGLDVGTMNLVASKQEGKKTLVNQQRNIFLDMEASEVSASMLQQSNVLHMRSGDKFLIVGEDALTFANVMNADARRPMSRGLLARDEKFAIPMMRLMMERLLDKPTVPGEVVYYTSPGNPVDSKINVTYHQKILEAVLKKMGYNPRLINEALCVVYAELSKEEFTGMGISCGAGMVNVGLTHLGVPLTSFSVARGGDWIDHSVSQATGQTKDKVTAIKEKDFRLDNRQGLNEAQAALTIYYDGLIDYATKHIENELRRVNVDEGLNIPVVITGGTSSPPGFIEAFEKALRKASLPFEIREVRRGSSNLFTVSLGALVGARAYEAEQKIATPS